MNTGYLAARGLFFDSVVLRLFKHVICRYVSKHLNRAHEASVINNDQLHDLDYYFKGDLKLQGYGNHE